MQPSTTTAGFGIFSGVFRPVFLTILGAMLYLREGWLVGNAGLGGALLVIAGAVSITGLTALSLASIATNVRVKPGGAFAITAQALGLEAGGAIGVPLYVAQSLSAAMYLYAFSEAWAFLFPTHDPRLVAVLGFVAMAAVAWRSASLAARAQAVMMVVVCVALSSGFAGWFTADELVQPRLVGRFQDASFAECFAIFFPAVTGIMVGAGMSGELADPRRSLPRGTLYAWGVTTGVYTLGAIWYATVGTPEELRANSTFMIEHAVVGPVVLGGLLCSTLMAGLSSLVAAPRLLQAMAEHGVVPASRWLGRTVDGEPRNATAATTALGAAGLLAGSLDAIAPIITSFFIMTYLAINLVVFVEGALDMISWRPTFRVARVLPLLGVGACLIGLAIGSPVGGLLELAMVLGIYLTLSRRQLHTPWETVRSGIAVRLAAWAARRAVGLERSERAWKPDLLVPVHSLEQLEHLLPIVKVVGLRRGSVRFAQLGRSEDLAERLQSLVDQAAHRQWDVKATALGARPDASGVVVAIEALGGALFPPNLVLVDGELTSDEDLALYRDHCQRAGVGLGLFLPSSGPTPNQDVSVWISDRSPDWQLKLHQRSLDLPVLAGYLAAQDRGARLWLHCVTREAESVGRADTFLRRLIDQARLPQAEVAARHGVFREVLAEAGTGLHVFGMPPSIEVEALRALRDVSGGACLFLLDSGQESALA